MASSLEEEEDLALAIAMSLRPNEDDKEPATLDDTRNNFDEQDKSWSGADLELAMTAISQTDARSTEDLKTSENSRLGDGSLNDTGDSALRGTSSKGKSTRRGMTTATLNWGNASRASGMDKRVVQPEGDQELVTRDGDMIFLSNPLYHMLGNNLYEDPTDLLDGLESIEKTFESKPPEDQWNYNKMAGIIYYELYLLHQHDLKSSALYMDRAILEIRHAIQKAPAGSVPAQTELLFTLTEILSEDARHSKDLQACPSYIELIGLWDGELELTGPAKVYRPLSLGYAMEQLYRIYDPSSYIATEILEKIISYGEECFELYFKFAQNAQWDKRTILLCYSKLERARGSKDSISIADIDETIGYTTEELINTKRDLPLPEDVLLTVAFNAWLCRYSRERNAYGMLRALQTGFATLDSLGTGHRNTAHVTRSLAALLDEQSQNSDLISSLSASIDMVMRLQKVEAGMLQLPAHQHSNTECASCNQHLTKRDRVTCEQCKFCSYCRTCAVTVGFSHLEHSSDELMVDVFGKVVVVELDITLRRFTNIAPAEPSDIPTSAVSLDSDELTDLSSPPPSKEKGKAPCHTDLSFRALQKYEFRTKQKSVNEILNAPPPEDLDTHGRAFYILEYYIISSDEPSRVEIMFHLRAAPKKPLPTGITRQVLLIELANMGIRLYDCRKEKALRDLIWDLAYEAHGLLRAAGADSQETLSCALVMSWFARESRLVGSGKQDSSISAEYTFARLAYESLDTLRDGPIVSAMCYMGFAEVFVTMYWARKTWRNLINADTWAMISLNQLSKIPTNHPAFQEYHLSVASILRNLSAALKDGAAELKTAPPLDEPVPVEFDDLDWFRPADALISSPSRDVVLSASAECLKRAKVKCQSSVDILKQFIDDPAVDASHQILCLVSSAQSLYEIFKQSQDKSFLLSSIEMYHQCLNMRHPEPKEHMRVAVELANILSTYELVGDHMDMVTTLANSVTVTLQLLSHNMSTEDQQLNLLVAHGFANTVAALYLGNGQVIEALSVLERGRNLMTNRIIDTRISVSGPEFEEVNELLSKFRDLQEAVVQDIDLDPTDLGFRRRREANPDPVYTHNLEMGWKRFKDRNELDKVAEKLRLHPRYADVLDGPGPDVMKGMADEGPIFVINVTASRCDTIVITASSITSVRLSALFLETVEYNRRKMEQMINDTDPRNWATHNKELSSILMWLWTTVVKPSWKEAIGRHTYTTSPRIALPRAWWIAGGPLEWAPLHVAGKFGGRASKNNITKLAISSYTPSVRALQYSRQKGYPTTQRNADKSILVVTMETTPGEAPLPGARQETEAVEKRAKDVDIVSVVLRQRPAHEVLRKIQDHAIVHFACHGVVDRRSPSSSSLLLQRTLDNTYSQQRYSRVVTFTGGAGVPTAQMQESQKGRLINHMAFSTYDEQQIPLAANNGRLVLGTKSTPGYSGLFRDPAGIPPQKDHLSVSALANLPLKPASPRYIAFLSACHSAFALSKLAPEGKYLEETISIAAGFHLAGFRHVIGALWKAKDEACVRISDCFYKTLFESWRDDHGEPEDAFVARALHIAVLGLIEEEPTQPLLWAPFIHIGT